MFLILLFLTWNASEGATGYKLYYGDQSREYTAVLDVGNITEYSIDLDITGRIYFAVTAYNHAGESGFSNEASLLVSDVKIRDSRDFAMYPNPFRDFVIFEIHESGLLEIFNLAGSQIFNRKVLGGEKIYWNPVESSGVYFVRYNDQIRKITLIK